MSAWRPRSACASSRASEATRKKKPLPGEDREGRSLRDATVWEEEEGSRRAGKLGMS